MGNKTLQNRVLDLEQVSVSETLGSLRIENLEQEVLLTNKSLIKVADVIKSLEFQINDTAKCLKGLEDQVKNITSRLIFKKNPVGRPPKDKQKQQQSQSSLSEL